MRYLSYILLGAAAVAAGIALPLQAAINVQLRGLLGSPLRASLGSFTVGLLMLATVVAFGREPLPGLGALARAPWWIWSGGLLGALYIVASIVLVPRLGSAYTFALVVTGQMLASIAIDRIGLFGIPQTPLSATRIAGAVLLVGGVLLVRR